jgi:molybdopterin/thiamine biosynthesis adenylyltransferase
MPKVDATVLMMRKIDSEVVVLTHNEKFDKQKKLSGGIVIASVDTMSARREIFDYCKAHTDSITLYVDTRMGGLEGQIYFVDMEDKKEIENYETSLFSDDQAVRQRCTERAIIFTVLGIVSLLCCNLIKAIKNQADFKNYIVFDFKEMQVI